ncbi:MAG: 30S ribosomal protein S4 [Nitrospirota bacterium]|nr:30S ribosomal protein S4 [Nitrospirota bacterium]
MARYTDSVCRLCRREGVKLFLKGDRCFKEKCAIDRRAYIPGQHGQSRRPKKPSDYQVQLREKQKIKRMYGMLEKQFRNLYEKAAKRPGITGHNLMAMLETRLDSVVYRLGFAKSRAQARQLVNHGHVKVNGRKVDISSYAVRVGEQITVKDKARENAYVAEAMESVLGRGLPAWLKVEPATFTGHMAQWPERDQIEQEVNEQLVVELYSR